ncbi:hypothetical protein BDV12DRAFT_196624 [Aspergillus spectabilis]
MSLGLKLDGIEEPSDLEKASADIAAAPEPTGLFTSLRRKFNKSKNSPENGYTGTSPFSYYGIFLILKRLPPARYNQFSGSDFKALSKTDEFINKPDEKILFDDPTTAIWMMSTAFEKPIEYDNPDPLPGFNTRDQWVLAAAQHILWSGHKLFKRISCLGDFDEDYKRSWKMGPFMEEI